MKISECVGWASCVFRISVPWVLLGGALSLVSCSGADDPPSNDASSLESALIQKTSWTTYPNRTINVCFTAASMNRPDYPKLKNRIIQELERNWAAVGIARFKYLDACPATGSKVTVTLYPANELTWAPACSANSGATPSGACYFPTCTSLALDALCSVYSIAFTQNQHTIAHEFGHALGFTHESARADFTETDGACPEDPVAGRTLGTGANDTGSQMNCSGAPQLSDFDDAGFAALYGGRSASLYPNVNGYNATTKDTFFTTAAVLSVSTTYIAQTFEGWSWGVPGVPGTVIAQRFTKAATGHTMYVVKQASKDLAIAEGYVYNQNGSYVYTAQQPGTVPLTLYRNTTTGDFLTTIKPPPAGYAPVRVEGYVFATRPFEVLQMWLTDSGDWLTTADDSPLIHEHGIGWYWADSAILKHQVEGTVPLITYYSPSWSDYYTSTGPYGDDYVEVRTEGYVFTQRSFGCPSCAPFVALRNYWSDGYTDSATTVDPNAWEDYEFIETVGYAMPINR